MFSTVLIIPENLREEANTLGEAMGWGPDNYSVPLSDGVGVTHYGLHAWSTQEFVDMMAAVGAGNIPPVPGLTREQVIAVTSALTVSIRPSSDGHWQEVLTEEELTVSE